MVSWKKEYTINNFTGQLGDLYTRLNNFNKITVKSIFDNAAKNDLDGKNNIFTATIREWNSLLSKAKTKANNLYRKQQVTTSQSAQTSDSAYKLGKIQAGARIIGADSVYGGNISLLYSNTMDGYIGDSYQGKRGDCYFLAEINAIRNTKGGQALLKKNCTKNSNGSYTVTLPGAIKIKNAYKEKKFTL